MSLLQDPKKVLEQTEWYVENKELEKFPGAFSMAAGNLCRQLIEQILFIISFYGELPKERYITSDDKILTPFKIINELQKKCGNSDMTYIDNAKRKGKRIEKFAYKLDDFDNWRRLFNESSHFRNPMRVRQLEDDDIVKFIKSMREIIDDKDCHLLTAAVNEMKSDGKIKVVFSNDKDNTVGLSMKIILEPKDIGIENKSLTIKSKKIEYYVVPNDEEIPYKIIEQPILIQHSQDIRLQFEIINKHGEPIELSNMQTILNGICRTKEEYYELRSHLKKYGIDVKISSFDKSDKDRIFTSIGRNELCSCGSGNKYKKCCIK